MNESGLVRLFGFPATVVHGDAAVLDRWLWLKRRLPKTRNGESLIELGCGSGAFTIGAALRGYSAYGLSWDQRNQEVARQRAQMSNADSARFDVVDIRHLDSRRDLLGQFDVAVCLETIEHVMDDRKLMRDMAACLKSGGRLLLTTPYYYYRPVTAGDRGPFSKVEDGSHVRRGYTGAMLAELCEDAGLVLERESHCTGLLSQKLVGVQRLLSRLHPLLAWMAVLPFRIFPPLFDRTISRLTGWPYFSICIEAYKPRFRSLGTDRNLLPE